MTKPTHLQECRMNPTTDSEPVFASTCDYDAGEPCQHFYVDATESTSTTDLEPSFVISSDWPDSFDICFLPNLSIL